MHSRARRVALCWILALSGLAGLRPQLHAQLTSGLVVAAPSRADSLLAVGRLAAAEQALYAAADARPRAPEPRGALGRYLASRGRFRIAEILLQEAQRFGADPNTVRRAISLMAPYRAPIVRGPVVAVAFTATTDARALFAFSVHAARGDVSALLDPSVRGVVVGSGAAASFAIRGARTALRIGDRELERLEVRVDSLAAPDEVRVGLDVLWGLRPEVDERAGVLTLGRAPDLALMTGRIEQIPFVLTFPGLLLVPRVGMPPIALESQSGRDLLRGTRWWISAAAATIVVER